MTCAGVLSIFTTDMATGLVGTGSLAANVAMPAGNISWRWEIFRAIIDAWTSVSSLTVGGPRKARPLQRRGHSPRVSINRLRSERHMPDLDPEARQHPVGTLAIVGIYGVLFAAGWLVVYVYVYLSRGPVTP